MADRLGVETVDREGDRVVFRFRPQTRLDPAQLVNLVQRRADVTLVPPSGLRLDLKSGAAGTAGATGAKSAADAERRKLVGVGKRPVRSPAAPASWWTARATAGEVTSGFTKAEILKPELQDPRGPTGVFTRVGGLLAELLG
jgi:hypothetical protein